MSVGRISGKGAAEQLIGIEEMLRKQSEQQLEQNQSGGKEQLETRSVLETAKAANTNVMGGNFSGNRIDPESSRYVEASLASFDVLRQQKNASIAQAWGNFDEFGGLQGGARRYAQRHKIFEKMNVTNEEIRDELEKKTQEAQAPKDAEGNPIPGATAGTEAEVPQVAVAPEPSPAASADAQMPEPEVTVAEPQVSIDIKV